MKQFSVTKDGMELSKALYTWDKNTKTFSTEEEGLVLDFSGLKVTPFKTGSGCTFETEFDCTFDTGSGCTFKTGPYCTFKTGHECVVVRRDIFEVIELTGKDQIKLNNYTVKGFTILTPTKTITIDGKDIEISTESFEELKKQYKN